MYFVVPHPPAPSAASPERRGLVLLVVISMLTLFAVVGVGFVTYAQSEATASKATREAETAFRPDVDPEQALAFYLSQLLYSAPDHSYGLESAMRGHDLATTMLGSYQPGVPNTSVYSGKGRWHTAPMDYPAAPGLKLFTADDYNLINYTYFASDGFLRDPGRPGMRPNPTAPMVPLVGGLNVPYTAPDLHSMCLAVVNGDGEVLLPSFHRPWTGIGSLDPTTNPNWQPTANPIFRYLTLRPHPSYHNNGVKQFPPPQDGGGDVKNNPFGKGVPVPGQPGKYYNNDSIWMDLGMPVLTAPNGMKYKALFAPLIVELDSKINLAYHGNIRGLNQTHVSNNHGDGPHNINPGKWLFVANPAEYKNLFLGTPKASGRYGPDGKPGTAPLPPLSSPSPFYSKLDTAGIDTGTLGQSTRFLMPGEGGNLPYNAFPFYPPTSFGDGDLAGRTDHPLLYNYFNPLATGDAKTRASAMEAWLRYRDTNSTALTSELYRLAPQNFASARLRWLTTLHSMDVGRAGTMPWLISPNTPGFPATATYARKTLDVVVPFQPPPFAPPQAWTSVVNNGEYGADSRAWTTGLAKVDLNRPLTPYPPVSNKGRMTDAAKYQQAVADRQQLARDLYDRLRLVCTGARPHEALPATGSEEYDALRYLAQLAVNIVDYRDSDDCSTPFRWDPAAATPEDGYVFGVELPRLTINEVYSEAANDPNDHGKGKGYGKGKGNGKSANNDNRVNFWIELHNPFMADANLADPVTGTPGAARLVIPADGASAGYPAYTLEVYQQSATHTKTIVNPDNVRGELPQADRLLLVDDFTPAPAPSIQPTLAAAQLEIVHPVNGGFVSPDGGNKGFYVLGPEDDFPGDQVQPTLRLPSLDAQKRGLSYAYKGNPPPRHTVLLRRLACPNVPPEPNPASPFYNPYLTVDFMNRIPVNNGVELGKGGPIAHAKIETRHAVGRKQPYAASELVQQEPGFTDQPQHTLLRHNAVETGNTPPSAATPGQTLHLPFDWLEHLDREFTSPIEIRGVATQPSHLLTRAFHVNVNVPGLLDGRHMQRLGATMDLVDGTRLYRFLEMIETRPRGAGLVANGRVPGKINPNFIWDLETFLAWLDPQDSAHYNTPANLPALTAMFDKMMRSRSPQAYDPLAKKANKSLVAEPADNSQPFQSLTVGDTLGDPQSGPTGNSGRQNTLLRNDPDNPANGLLFGVGDNNTHPQIRDEVLRKIFNSTTVRSNVFAVWLTVGFFEVLDDTVRPAKLGPEIGWADKRQLRHRMFAIVDRTALGAVPSDLTVLQSNVTVQPGPQIVTLQAVNGTHPLPVATPPLGVPLAGPYAWDLKSGDALVVGRGTPNEETITVLNVDVAKKQIAASFSRPHVATELVSLPGNLVITAQQGVVPGVILGHPGPQTRFNPRVFTEVVPHLSIIE